MKQYIEHHIRYFERFSISQFNDSSGRVDLIYNRLKFSNGHNLLKCCPNWAYEVFIDICKICRLKFSNGHNLLKCCPKWAYEVFFDICKICRLKFSNGHNLLKCCPNWAYEVFFDICKILQMSKNTSYAQFGQHLSKL